jgi:hypothetical protein
LQQILNESRPCADTELPGASCTQVRDFVRDVGHGQSQSVHVRLERGTLHGQFDALGRALDQLRAHRLFQSTKTLAQRRLGKVERFGRTPEMAMLGDYSEIFKVAQFHPDNRNS